MTSPAGMNTFPGGTAVTHLAVYDWSTPDGLRGGSAHVHLACTEGYVVIGGTGRLQTLGADGYAETPLAPLTVAWFSPGVIHRLVNEENLRILVVMQNSGLPEAGDAVMTFPPEILADRERYRAAVRIADAPAEEARARRDLAVDGFLALRARVAAEGPAALEEFYDAAAGLVRDLIPQWRERWTAGPLASVLRTADQLDALAEGGFRHLHDGRLSVLGPPERTWGMCGRLRPYAGTDPRPAPPGSTDG
jgi:mannose-6-phosphate isomerase-like protein (cupin superfamily)